MAAVFAEILDDAGYAVHYAAHAQAAIVELDRQVPDVIVVDMLLTGATAFALLHELQSYDDSRHIPVILCSNIADTLDAENLGAYGVVRVLDKTTMKPVDLVAAVRGAL